MHGCCARVGCAAETSMSMSYRRLAACGLSLLLSVAGCGSDDAEGGSTRNDNGNDSDAAADAASTHDPEDAGSSVDASAPGDASAPADASIKPAPESDVVVTNTSFESALAVTGPDAPLQFVTHAGQAAYFKFEGKADTFYVLSTERGTFSPDNTISVFNSDHELIAANDVGSVWFGDYIDARLLLRLDAEGTYYIRAEDRSIPSEYLNEKFETLRSYHMQVKEIPRDEPTPGYAFVSGADIVFQHDPTMQFTYVTLLGDLQPGRQDAFTIRGAESQALIGQLLQTSLGDTANDTPKQAPPLAVSVLDAMPPHTLARIERANGQFNIHPPVSDASYSVEVDLTDKAAAHAFYAIDLVMLAENPPEKSDDANDQVTGAEVIELSGSSSRRGRVLARLPAADVDYYRFEASEGEAIRVGCEAESGGSGVRALKAELLDATEKSLAVSKESASESLEVKDVPVPATGTYYLRLSADAPASAPTANAQGSDVIEPWVRCAVIAAPVGT